MKEQLIKLIKSTGIDVLETSVIIRFSEDKGVAQEYVLSSAFRCLALAIELAKYAGEDRMVYLLEEVMNKL